MNFIGTLEGNEYKITVENSEKPQIYNVYLDGKKYVLDAHAMPSEIVSVLLNNKSYDVDLDRSNIKNTLDGHMTVRVRGRDIDLEMLDERRKKMKDAQSSTFLACGISLINSPMPGKILRILVNENDSVVEGQGLIVIEAMKMENELKSPKDGVVKELLAVVGEPVESSALLMTIE